MDQLFITLETFKNQPIDSHYCIRTTIEGENAGEIDAPLDCLPRAPFDREELITVLDALAICEHSSRSFSLEEIERLKAWDLLDKDYLPDEKEWIELSDRDIDIDLLEKFVRAKLRDVLFPTEAHRFALLKCTSDKIHLRLEIPAGKKGHAQNVQLFQYPWELLENDRGELLGDKTIIVSRYIRYRKRQLVMTPRRNLNALFITARPLDKNLQYGQENDIAVMERIDRAGKLMSFNELERAGLSHLDHYLRQKPSPDILHFDGHGQFGRRCRKKTITTDFAEHCQCCRESIARKPFYGFLAFSDDKNHADWVRADELAEILKRRRHKIQLIVLNACQSGVGRHGEDIFNGVAQNLIHHVPAVVATSFPIQWKTALRFSEIFYEELLNGAPLVDVMAETRFQLRRYWEAPREWYRIVLYLREKDTHGGRLLMIDEIEEPDDETGQPDMDTTNPDVSDSKHERLPPVAEDTDEHSVQPDTAAELQTPYHLVLEGIALPRVDTAIGKIPGLDGWTVWLDEFGKPRNTPFTHPSEKEKLAAISASADEDYLSYCKPEEKLFRRVTQLPLYLEDAKSRTCQIMPSPVPDRYHGILQLPDPLAEPLQLKTLIIGRPGKKNTPATPDIALDLLSHPDSLLWKSDRERIGLNLSAVWLSRRHARLNVDDGLLKVGMDKGSMPIFGIDDQGHVKWTLMPENTDEKRLDVGERLLIGCYFLRFDCA